jgi:lysophospholipase L1-like esterase
MQFRQAALYNVQDLLKEDAEDLLTDTALKFLAEANLSQYLPQGSGDEGLWLSRLPDTLRRQLNPLAQLMALSPAGCELRFNLRGERARLTLRSATPPKANGVSSATLEVFQGVFRTGLHAVGTSPTTIDIVKPANQALVFDYSRQCGAPFDAELTRVVLPWEAPVQLIGLEGDIEPARPEQVPARRLLSYGSSITHGALAVRPTGSWASRLAQRLEVDGINLGFGGGAHLEPEMADYIATRDDWDLATIELGINILGAVNVDEFAQRVAYFVPRIAQAHPDKWLFCIDIFRCAHDPANADKLAAFRRVVRDQVAALAMPRVVHIPGEEMLTRVDGLAADLVHPSPAGMEEIAANLGRRIREHLPE